MSEPKVKERLRCCKHRTGVEEPPSGTATGLLDRRARQRAHRLATAAVAALPRCLASHLGGLTPCLLDRLSL